MFEITGNDIPQELKEAILTDLKNKLGNNNQHSAMDRAVYYLKRLVESYNEHDSIERLIINVTADFVARADVLTKAHAIDNETVSCIEIDKIIINCLDYVKEKIIKHIDEHEKYQQELNARSDLN